MHATLVQRDFLPYDHIFLPYRSQAIVLFAGFGNLFRVYQRVLRIGLCAAFPFTPRLGGDGEGSACSASRHFQSKFSKMFTANWRQSDHWWP